MPKQKAASLTGKTKTKCLTILINFELFKQLCSCSRGREITLLIERDYFIRYFLSREVNLIHHVMKELESLLAHARASGQVRIAQFSGVFEGPDPLKGNFGQFSAISAITKGTRSAFWPVGTGFRGCAIVAAVPSTALTGAAGAYHVAGELSQRGWMASLTQRNAPRTDVLAQDLRLPLLAAIQVKTRRVGDFQIGVGGEHPSPAGLNEWYALVSLRPLGERADFYIIPRNHVSAFVFIGFWNWIAEAPEGGRRNPEGRHRTGTPADFAGYHERWDLLEATADDAPWLLEPWLWEAEREVGLPEGHPGLGVCALPTPQPPADSVGS